MPMPRLLSRLLGWFRPVQRAALVADFDPAVEIARIDAETPPDPAAMRETAPRLTSVGDVDVPAQPPTMWSRFAAMASHVDSMVRDGFYNLTSGLGSTGDRATLSRVNTAQMPLNAEERDALYRFNGFARRIVDIVPEMAMKSAGSFVVPGEADGDPLEQQMQDIGAWAAVSEAWKLARKDGSCLTLIITDDDIPVEYRDTPGRWLAQPLDLSRVRGVRALINFEREEFDAADWYSETADFMAGKFRRVKSWHVTPTTPNASDALAAGLIHESRCLYWDGAYVTPRQRIKNNGHGDSVLDVLMDQLQNKTEGGQALGTLLHELKINIIKLKGLAAHSVSDQKAAYDTRMNTIAKGKSSLNTILLDEGEEFLTQAQTVTGYDKLDTRLTAALSAVSRIPRTILDGESPGGLNADGESSRLNMANMVMGEADFYAAPNIRRLGLVMFSAQEGPTGGQVPEKWGFDWAPLDEPTSEQRADLRKKHAERDAIYLQWGVVSPEHVARSRFGPSGYGDELMAIDEDEQPPGAALAEAVREAVDRADAETFTVPEAARNNARKVLRWREEHGEDVKGMTAVGWRRARQLAEQGKVSRDVVAKMAQFARHRKNAAVAPEHKGEPWKDAGHVAWLGWGGTTGIEWAKGIMESERNDADDGVWVGFLFDGPTIAKWEGARTAAETITGGMRPAPHDPHATLVYLGGMSDADARTVANLLDEVIRAGAWLPNGQRAEFIEAFPVGPDGTPVVVSLSWSDAMSDVRRRLLDAIAAHPDADRLLANLSQHGLRPHATVGYFPGEMPGPVREQLWGAREAVGWPVTYEALEIRRGGALLQRWEA